MKLRRTRPLALVALGFFAVQLILFDLDRYYEWDEAVYASQALPAAKAMYWGPTRARGISWLIVPVASFSENLALIRLYLAAVSSVALYFAFAAWRGIDRRIPAVAGALFAGTWLALFYGSEISPNLYSALAGVALTGFTLRATTQPPTRRTITGIVVSSVVMGQFRPIDELTLTLGLVVTVVLLGIRLSKTTMDGSPALTATIPTRVRTVSLALLAGVPLGWSAWLIESLISYGGPISRLQTSVTEVNGGLGVSGWGFYLTEHLRLTDGPIIGFDPIPAPLGGLYWWVLLALLASIGVARRQTRGTALTALLAAAAVATPYFILTPLAPRFLIPGYALLSVAASLAVIHRRSLVPGPNWVANATVALLLGVTFSWHVQVGNTFEAEQAHARSVSVDLAAAIVSANPSSDCAFWSQYASPQIELATAGCIGGRIRPESENPPAGVTQRQEANKLNLFLLLSDPAPGSFLDGVEPIEIKVPDDRSWWLYSR